MRAHPGRSVSKEKGEVAGFFKSAQTHRICRIRGALAQLGERLPCTQEVSGSIPLGSTILQEVSDSSESSHRPLGSTILPDSPEQ